jgi:hypothetical protein
MDLTKLSKQELLVKCEEYGFTKCKSKNKGQLIDLINSKHKIENQKKRKLIIEEDNTENDNINTANGLGLAHEACDSHEHADILGAPPALIADPVEYVNEGVTNIIEDSEIIFNNIMDNWCQNFDDDFSGGKMRGARGEDIEKFVKNVVNMFRTKFNVNVRAVKGNDDKKELKVPGTEIKKDHQVDIHIYKNDVFIAVIECKAYLDSCYYVRACSDFTLFNKFGYNVKKYIFTLEKSIKEETKLFTDYETDNVCDDIFYMLDGNRTSTKPIYDKKHKKNINKEKLIYFVKSLQKLLVDI